MEDEGRARDKSCVTTSERTGNIPGPMNGGLEMSAKMALRLEETLAGRAVIMVR